MKKIAPLLLSTALLISPSLFASQRPAENYTPSSPQPGKQMSKITVDDFVTAARESDLETIKKYLEQGGDINITRRGLGMERTALWLAVAHRQLEAVRYLLNHKADPNKPDSLNYTPLWSAAVQGFEGIIKLLLEHGANINQRLGKGGSTTLLHEVISRIDKFTEFKKLETVSLLIKAGADINGQEKTGETPLHLAAQKNNLQIIKLLCDSGADPFIENQEKKLPVDLTTSSEVKEYLNRLPKPLHRQSLERVRKMMQEGTITKEEAKQKLPTNLWEKL